jgi:hypothetical protein
MSAEFKLDQPKSDQEQISSINKKINIRPNIDDLLKRISLERQKEKRVNLVMIFLAILGIIVASFLYSQA